MKINKTLSGDILYPFIHELIFKCKSYKHDTSNIDPLCFTIFNIAKEMSLISLTQQDRKECKNKAKRIWQDVSMASDANYATNSRTHAEVMAVHIARVGYNLVAHLCKPDNVGLFWTLFFSFNELLNFEDTK